MLLRYLRYLTVLASEKHFARAATVCNVTQPTLSAGIVALERELNVRLVLRNRRYVSLTPEGEAVLPWAKRMLADQASLVQAAGVPSGTLTGHVRLGVIPAAMPAVGPLAQAFCARHPAVTIGVHAMTSGAIRTGLTDAILDGGLTYLDHEPLSEVRSITLYREQYRLATRPDGVFGGAAHVSWHDAAAQPLCLLGPTMQNRRVIDAVLARLGIAVAPRVTSDSFLGILSLVRTGIWLSIVPHSFVYLFGEQPDLVLLPLVEPSHEQSIGLLTSNREPVAPLTEALIHVARTLQVSSLFSS